MPSHLVAIGLGSNLGDRLDNLAGAVEALGGLLDGVRRGSVVRSPPEDGSDQPDYFNTVVVGTYDSTPEDLLAELKYLEHAHGRRRAERNAARIIDLDLLLFDDLCIDRQELTLPHPRLAVRAFVLVPLAAVAADWRVSPSGTTVATLLEDLGQPAGLREVLPAEEGV